MKKRNPYKMKNTANEPHKDIYGEKTFNDNRLSIPYNVSDELDEYDSPFDYDDDCLWDIDDDPMASRIQVGPELKKIGILHMVLFERSLIFETKDGIVFLNTTKEGSHSFYHPLKKPWQKHARALMKTTYSLLNAGEFRASLRERMNGP